MQQESTYLWDVVSYFAKIHRLTAREREIVYCLVKYGYSNRRLADALCITEKTVKNHIAKIQDKTKTRSTRELMSLVVEQFIVHHQMVSAKAPALAL